MKILVVEDDPIVATIYTRSLHHAGYQADVIADGSDAFHALHTKDYELVLLDIMLPNMDGMAILRRIRAQKKFQYLPIVVITGMQIKAVQAQIIEAGATQVMSKGEFSPQKLVEIVKELIAAKPVMPLEILPEPIIEEVVQKRPDLRVKMTEAPAAPALNLRMADHPESRLPPKLRLEGGQDPSVKIVEDTGKPEKKPGLFGRLFGKKES